MLRSSPPLCVLGEGTGLPGQSRAFKLQSLLVFQGGEGKQEGGGHSESWASSELCCLEIHRAWGHESSFSRWKLMKPVASTAVMREFNGLILEAPQDLGMDVSLSSAFVSRPLCKPMSSPVANHRLWALGCSLGPGSHASGPFPHGTSPKFRLPPGPETAHCKIPWRGVVNGGPVLCGTF